MGLEVERSPVGVVEHQFDVGLLRDDPVDPLRVPVVLEDTIVELTGLGVAQGLEIHAVKVLDGDVRVAVEARGAQVVKLWLGPGPPLLEGAAVPPFREPVDPTQVTVPPQTGQGHSAPPVGLHVTGHGVVIVTRTPAGAAALRGPLLRRRGRSHQAAGTDEEDQQDSRPNEANGEETPTFSTRPRTRVSPLLHVLSR